jgi:hypothetical protein
MIDLLNSDFISAEKPLSNNINSQDQLSDGHIPINDARQFRREQTDINTEFLRTLEVSDRLKVDRGHSGDSFLASWSRKISGYSLNNYLNRSTLYFSIFPEKSQDIAAANEIVLFRFENVRISFSKLSALNVSST